MEPPNRAKFLDLLAAYFAGPLQIVEGQSLYTGRHPARVDQAVVLTSSGGTSNLALCGLRWTHVQVMTRALDYVWSSNRAWMAHELAHQMARNIEATGPIVLGTPPNQVTILNCHPVSEPSNIGMDEADGHLFSLNLRFQLGVTARQ